MARDDHLKHLGEVTLFSSLSKKDLRTIAKASTEATFEPGRVLTDQGGAGREAFVILNGTAAVKRSNRKIATLGPGDCVGELALLDRGPRTATVVTETPVRALVLGNREFNALLDEVPGLSHKLLAALATRVRELDSKVFG
jgi:CRP/FNR family cyclic AMP-dependent transcriptional regulator